MLVNLRGQGDFVNFIWPLFFGLLLSVHYCNTIKETISFSIVSEVSCYDFFILLICI